MKKIILITMLISAIFAQSDCNESNWQECYNSQGRDMSDCQLQGTSIYDLKLLMGHSSVTTTEVYSNMNLKRVSQDFPTIVSKYVNEAKIGKEDTSMEDTIALPMIYAS